MKIELSSLYDKNIDLNIQFYTCYKAVLYVKKSTNK